VRTMFVASSGGHMEELWSLRARLGPLARGDRTWVTFDTPQSRSLLADEQRIFIPGARPRDPRATLTHARFALHILGLGGWDAVVSTGCLPAVPFLSLARARGIQCHFIESATRTVAPSMTGQLLERIPGVHRYSQHRWPDRPGWRYGGSVFDSFRGVPSPARDVVSVVVTVGISDVGFSRLLRAVAAALPPGADVLWQVGHNDATGLPGTARPFVPHAELGRAMDKADLVICHAGVGSALAAFGAGHCPIVVPRRLAHGEHVDDHQVELAHALADRGLAVAVEADAIDARVLAQAASRRVARIDDPPAFGLAAPTVRRSPAARLGSSLRRTAA